MTTTPAPAELVEKWREQARALLADADELMEDGRHRYASWYRGEMSAKASAHMADAAELAASLAAHGRAEVERLLPGELEEISFGDDNDKWAAGVSRGWNACLTEIRKRITDALGEKTP